MLANTENFPVMSACRLHFSMFTVYYTPSNIFWFSSDTGLVSGLIEIFSLFSFIFLNECVCAVHACVLQCMYVYACVYVFLSHTVEVNGSG